MRNKIYLPKSDHPILKETLKFYKNNFNRNIGLEITSIADGSGGTGLGSSGSFGVAPFNQL